MGWRWCVCLTTITFGSRHPRLNQGSAGGFELEVEAKEPEPVMERAVEDRKWLWVGEFLVEFGCVFAFVLVLLL